jgi:hypothetical protein
LPSVSAISSISTSNGTTKRKEKECIIRPIIGRNPTAKKKRKRKFHPIAK